MTSKTHFEFAFLEACARAEAETESFLSVAAERLPAPLCEEAIGRITQWESYQPTPLVPLPGLAGALGVAKLTCKDEGPRFGLGSFKALGGAYAVDVLHRGHEGPLTVACATEGNHGRSVAWGARQAGARCIIFLHENVSAAREQAIAAYGAEIRRVPGNYDDAVLNCAETAEKEGWTIVSDTTWPGYETIPTWVMAGYSVIVKELLEQQDEAPTHVFLQAGVGGMAAAVMAAFAHFGSQPLPRFITVEPRNAACILQSVRHAGQLETVKGSLKTVSAGLACGAPSPLALSIIYPGIHAALAIDDEAIVDSMRRLGKPKHGDQAVVSGASGAAGLGGLIAALRDTALCEMLELNASSRVLFINTEGDTDPDGYRKLMNG